MELQQLILVIDIAKNLEGLRRDMIDNARAYQQMVQDGKTDVEIRTLILANNIQYNKRLDWIKNLYDNHKTALSSALSSLNITIAHTIQNYQELKDVADATSIADLSSVENITTHINYILENIQPHLTVW